MWCWQHNLQIIYQHQQTSSNEPSQLDTFGHWRTCISWSCFQNEVLLKEFYPILFALPLLQLSSFNNLFWILLILFLPHTNQIFYHNLTTTFLPSPTWLCHFKHPIFPVTTSYPPERHLWKYLKRQASEMIPIFWFFITGLSYNTVYIVPLPVIRLAMWPTG